MVGCRSQRKIRQTYQLWKGLRVSKTLVLTCCTFIVPQRMTRINTIWQGNYAKWPIEFSQMKIVHSVPSQGLIHKNKSAGEGIQPKNFPFEFLLQINILIKIDYAWSFKVKCCFSLLSALGVFPHPLWWDSDCKEFWFPWFEEKWVGT